MILQEASDHVPHVSGQFHTNTDGNDPAIFLNKDTFEPVAVFPITEPSTSKDTWGLAALVVRGLPRRPSVADSSTVTFCTVHIHNKVVENVMQRLASCVDSATTCSAMLISLEGTLT